MLQIHEKIRQARLTANLTEDQLAEKIGISRSTYQYWEQKTPSLEKIRKVAKALELPEDHFLNEKDETFVKPAQEPLIDTILNLTYSSRKTADGIDKMADANLINARSIETLVKILAASLGATGLKGVSLEDLQTGDVPVEAFLGGQPATGATTPPPPPGKKQTKSR